MSKLVAPHGGKGLVCCKLHGNELAAEQEKAKGMKKIHISARAKGDLLTGRALSRSSPWPTAPFGRFR